jgi:hypothetical protein
MPIYQLIRNGMHALLGNLVPQIIISTVATLTTLLVTSIFPIVTNSALPLRWTTRRCPPSIETQQEQTRASH